MSHFEIYTFVLCLIVLVSLTALFATLLTLLVRLWLRLIRHGLEDRKILLEFDPSRRRSFFGRLTDGIAKLFSLVVCVALCLCFVFSLTLFFSENDHTRDIPTLRVVKSPSMSVAHEKNTYLTKNGLDNQFQTFDLICLYELPAEADLKLYDIVLYEVDETLIIHRIVGIEEPNEKHPDERYFLLQGDAVERPDRFPVHYSQMRAIYRGGRIPYLGSFVSFLQSPAGWLCIILVVVAMIASPIVEKKMENAKEERLAIILAKQNAKAQQRAIVPQYLSPQWGAPVLVYPVYYNPSQRTGQATPPQRKGGKK